MSDTETDPADANVPDVCLLPQTSGSGVIGVMHLGDKVRTFVGNNIDHARRLIVSAGISEWGLNQDGAEALAEQHLPTIARPDAPVTDAAAWASVGHEARSGDDNGDTGEPQAAAPAPVWPPVMPLASIAAESWAAVGRAKAAQDAAAVIPPAREA
jgi:hypothetical protein